MEDPFAKSTPARTPPPLIYNTDTVYSTTTFRPVSPSPLTPPAPESLSPKRTRKLETPLHFDGGLFSDIRSTDGKLLSKVTVDKIYRSTRHDVMDSPGIVTSSEPHNYVDDIVKTETITNEDVIKVKFTPVQLEVDSPRLRTPLLHHSDQIKSPVEYLKGDYEDLQSYKIVRSLCNEKAFESESANLGEEHTSEVLMPIINRSQSSQAKILESDKNIERVNLSNKDFFEFNNFNVQVKDIASVSITEPIIRMHSPLANLLVSEQLCKIDNYLQESLDICVLGEKIDRTTPSSVDVGENSTLANKNLVGTNTSASVKKLEESTTENDYKEIQNIEHEVNFRSNSINEERSINDVQVKNNEKKPLLNNAKEKRPGILHAIYAMPIHYHAAILCFLLIVYNFIYQYIKQNCNVNKNI